VTATEAIEPTSQLVGFVSQPPVEVEPEPPRDYRDPVAFPKRTGVPREDPAMKEFLDHAERVWTRWHVAHCPGGPGCSHFDKPE
jgi:hypothetical protein